MGVVAGKGVRDAMVGASAAKAVGMVAGMPVVMAAVMGVEMPARRVAARAAPKPVEKQGLIRGQRAAATDAGVVVAIAQSARIAATTAMNRAATLSS